MQNGSHAIQGNHPNMMSPAAMLSGKQLNIPGGWRGVPPPPPPHWNTLGGAGGHGGHHRAFGSPSGLLTPGGPGSLTSASGGGRRKQVRAWGEGEQGCVQKAG